MGSTQTHDTYFISRNIRHKKSKHVKILKFRPYSVRYITLWKGTSPRGRIERLSVVNIKDMR